MFREDWEETKETLYTQMGWDRLAGTEEAYNSQH